MNNRKIWFNSSVCPETHTSMIMVKNLWQLSFFSLFIALSMSFMLSTDAMAANVLFDQHHAQSIGNADWTLEGAYSELGKTLENLGHRVFPTTGKITAQQLASAHVLVIPEPNILFTEEEMDLITDFVRNGGGLFCIGDHTGSDRNFSGADSVEIFNAFLPRLGLAFERTWQSQAPVPPTGNDLYIQKGIKHGLGAWAAGSIRLIHSDPKASFITDKNKIYVAQSEPVFGRVVAIADSAPFSDGTGADHKKLHDSYHSFLYDHPQFVANVIWWLSHEESAWKEVPSAYASLVNIAPATPTKNDVWIDCAHHADDSDKVMQLAKTLNQMGYVTKWKFKSLNLPSNLNLLNHRNHRNVAPAMIISSAPDKPWKPSEIESVCRWLRNGGMLILTGGSDYAPLGRPLYHNRLLESCGADLRFCDDQVQDKVYNTGRPWGPVLQKTVTPQGESAGSVIAWGACSLSDRHGKRPISTASGRIKILAEGVESTVVTDGNRNRITGPKEKPPVVIALEKVGKGIVLVSGAPLLVDFNWPDSPIYPAEYKSMANNTPGFIRNILKYMVKVVNENSLQ